MVLRGNNYERKKGNKITCESAQVNGQVEFYVKNIAGQTYLYSAIEETVILSWAIQESLCTGECHRVSRRRHIGEMTVVVTLILTRYVHHLVLI